MKILLILHHLELYQQERDNLSFLRNPENKPPPNPKLEEHKSSEGIKVPWQTTPENEEGSFQCPYCDHPPYKYHKALLTHLETKHLDIKT